MGEGREREGEGREREEECGERERGKCREAGEGRERGKVGRGQRIVRGRGKVVRGWEKQKEGVFGSRREGIPYFSCSCAV